MQDLLIACVFAVLLATSPHPVAFILCSVILAITFGFRLFIAVYLPHKRGHGRRYL